MSSQRRTAEFNDVKVRGLRWQNPDGSFPAEGSVLSIENSTGLISPSLDLSLNSVTVTTGSFNSLTVGGNPIIPGGGGIIIYHPTNATPLAAQPLVIETGRLVSSGTTVSQAFSQLQNGAIYYKTQTITAGSPSVAWSSTNIQMSGSGGVDWMAVGTSQPNVPTGFTPGLYRYTFSAAYPGPAVAPTSVSSTVFSFFPNPPVSSGITQINAEAIAQSIAPVFVPSGIPYTQSWFVRFSLYWQQPTATINLKFDIADGFALQYRDYTTSSSWSSAGESWISAPAPSSGGNYRYSLPLSLTQNHIYDFELVIGNFPNTNSSNGTGAYVINNGTYPANNADMTNPLLNGLTSYSFGSFMYWHSY